MIKVAVWGEAIAEEKHSGTQTFLLYLVRRILRDYSNVIDLIILCPSWLDCRVIEQRVSVEGLRVHIVKGSKWRLRVQWLLGMHSLTDQVGGVDIFFSGWQVPFGRDDTPFIGLIHDVRPLMERSDSLKTFLYALFWRFSIRACVSRSSAIVFPSDYTRRQFHSLGFVEEQEVAVIHHGVSLEDWNPSGPQSPPLVSGEYVLAIGQHVPNKNFRRLITAFHAGLSKLDKNSSLVIAGAENVETDDLRALIDEYNLSTQVVLTGSVTADQIVNLMRNAKIFAFPSLHEGFGIPVLEAFASGTPVLCSNITALVEVGGDAVVSVDPQNVDQIANGLVEMWFDRSSLDRLRQLGSSRIKLFEWARSIDQYVSLFEVISLKNKKNV